MLTAGLILMIAAVLDPMEGSIAVLAGSAIAAAGAVLGRLPRARVIVIASAFVAFGVGAAFALSSVGGFGGTSGRSMWLGVLILPYPLGWIGAVAAAIMSLRASRQITA